MEFFCEHFKRLLVVKNFCKKLRVGSEHASDNTNTQRQTPLTKVTNHLTKLNLRHW